MKTLTLLSILFFTGCVSVEIPREIPNKYKMKCDSLRKECKIACLEITDLPDMFDYIKCHNICTFDYNECIYNFLDEGETECGSQKQ